MTPTIRKASDAPRSTRSSIAAVTITKTIQTSSSASVSPERLKSKVMSHKSIHQNFRVRKSEFVSRSSQLDAEYVMKEASYQQFFGFFTAFWMALWFYVFASVYRNMASSGQPLRMYLFQVFTKDALNLVIGDATMIASTFGALIIIKLLTLGFLPLWLGFLLHHAWQLVWFGSWIGFIWYKNWPWVQTGFFVMHTIVMLMKQHSYLDTNRELMHKLLHVDELAGKLKRLADHENSEDDGNNESDSSEDSQAVIEAEIADLKEELSLGAGFPNNVTFGNFVDYLAVPTLVYELAYPRTTHIRVSYLAFKIFSTFSAFFILYITVDEFVLPVLHQMPNLSFLDALVGLLFPFAILYLLLFFIIFECILNAFAEMTRFADRLFYEDWWNSTSWDQYARRWNRPVHEFLLRHVYMESLRHRQSKTNATFITFFLSSCFHELVMVVVGRRVRMYLFGLQMAQLPLIYVMRLPFIRQHKILGNMIFWWSIFIGPPLLSTLYCREHFLLP